MSQRRPKELDRPNYYPLFVDLNDRLCLVIGGGSVGERKIKGLLGSGASIRLIAQTLTPWLQSLCEEKLISFFAASYEENSLDDADLVFAATSDPALNRRIASDARKRKLWCNMATEPERGSFIVPSSFQRGPLSVAVSTGGLSPAVAKRVGEKLEQQFGHEWVIFIGFLGIIRSAVQAKELESQQNQLIFRSIASLPIPEWIAAGRNDLALQAVHGITESVLSWEELNQLWDEIWKTSSLP
jgi:precorrin-2 dehydrogenase / sirohydrochlorin ferrochelatase